MTVLEQYVFLAEHSNTIGNGLLPLLISHPLIPHHTEMDALNFEHSLYISRGSALQSLVVYITKMFVRIALHLLAQRTQAFNKR